MKTILVCDSGLGGMDIAARLLTSLRQTYGPLKLKLIYFNAWPEVGCGYNHLPTLAEKIRISQAAFAGMRKFHPDWLVIGCNTLSVLRRLADRPEPNIPIVSDMLSAVEQTILEGKKAHPNAHIVITGTATTVGSGYYRDRLIANGIAADEILSLPCPGLAESIESGPEGPAAERKIMEFAEDLRQLLRQKLQNPQQLLLTLCCTHYGYSRILWEKIFAGIGEFPLLILNPNEAFHANPPAPPEKSETGNDEVTVEVHSRIELAPEKISAMASFLGVRIPEFAKALRCYHWNPQLFEI